MLLGSMPAFPQDCVTPEPPGAGATGATTIDSTGTFHALIIFAKFPDGEEVLANGNPWPRCTCGADDWVPSDVYPPNWADSLIESSTPPLIDGSLTDFFYTWSQGKHALIGDILDTVLVTDSTIAYYDTTFSTGVSLTPAVHANLNILAKADPLVDFSQYDGNGDGVVDYVFVYYQSGNTWVDSGSQFYSVTAGPTATSSVTPGGTYTTMDQDAQQRTMVIPWNGGSTILPALLQVSGAKTLVQHRWLVMQILAHEYGHDLLAVARINVSGSASAPNGDHLENASRYTIMHGTFPSGLMMTGLERYKLNWIDPPIIRATTTPFDTTITLSASYLDHDGTFAIVEPDPAVAPNCPQYFVLEAKRDNLPGEIYNSRQPSATCCYPTLQNDRGLLITHVADSSLYRGQWTTTTNPFVDRPPVIDIEVARGAFDTTDASPDPIAGLTNIRSFENIGLGGNTARSHDLFTPQAVGGEQRSNAFTPWTNPNTNLYDDGADPQVPNWHQTIYSGISLYDIEWTSAAEESIRVKIRFDNPTPPADADTIHVDMTLQGLVQLTGDVVVAPSATVTVLEDAMIVAATTDRFQAGLDTGAVEFIVPGNLQVQGGDSAVVFTSSRDDAFKHWMIVPGTAVDDFNYPGEVAAAAPGDWRGFRMLLQGTQSGSLYNCSGAISNAAISYADRAIALEENCAPSITGVTFASNNFDIFADSTDVFVPQGNPWDLAGPVLAIFTNATRAGQDFSPGHAGKVDLIPQGPFNTSGDASNMVRFRPQFPTDAVGDDWGGIYMDSTSAGSQIEYAEISHAANPIFFDYPDGSALRHSTIHHFKDVGPWIFQAKGAGMVVDSNLVQRDDTTTAGDNLQADYGNLGILIEKSAPMSISGNKVILKEVDNLIGGAGIEFRNTQGWCLGGPSSSDSVKLVQNRVIGAGQNFGGPNFIFSGVEFDWACRPGTGLVYVAENNVTDWNRAGLYFTQALDVQVSCNAVKANRRNVDFTRTWAAPDVVKFRQNTIEGHTIGPNIHSAIRTDRADKIVLGPDAATTGDNIIKTTGLPPSGRFIFENDPSNGRVLNADGNQWYITGTLTPDSTVVRPRITKEQGATGQVLVTIDALKQSPSNPSCSVPTMALAGAGFAVAPEAHAGALEALPMSSVPERTALHAAGPSPFRNGTELQVDVAQAARATLRIYDVRGRLVRVLSDQDLAPGRYRISWDGRDGSGHNAAAGAYFVRLEAGSVRQVQKVIRVQ